LRGRAAAGAGRARALLALVAAGGLAGCGASDNDPGPGGVTVGEARALDEAAEMLDEQRLPEQALSEPGDADGPAEGEAAAESGD
jgi:hypothetical protein